MKTLASFGAKICCVMVPVMVLAGIWGNDGGELVKCIASAFVFAFSAIGLSAYSMNL